MENVVTRKPLPKLINIQNRHSGFDVKDLDTDQINNQFDEIIKEAGQNSIDR